jgi:hypothetical protein
LANYRVSRNTNSSSNKKNTRTKHEKQRKIDHLRLFTFKREFLKTSVALQTVLSAETHLAERQCLEELLNILKLRIFGAGTRISTVSRAEGQHLELL